MLSDHFAKMVDEIKQKRADDARRYDSLDMDHCQLCHAHGEDKRSLFVSCFYRISECLPEAIDLGDVEKFKDSKVPAGYYLRICKACRGRFLGHLKEWRKECLANRSEHKDHDGNLGPSDPEHNIPVRINGAIRWLNQAEWDNMMAKD